MSPSGENAHPSRYIAAWLLLVRRVGWLLTLLLLTAPAQASEPVGSNLPVLRLGIGEGLAVHLPHRIAMLKRGFEVAGFKLELVSLPAGRSLSNAAAGRIDGDVLHRLDVAQGFPSLVPIKASLLRVDLWVWVKRENACPATQQQLQDLTTSTVTGYSFQGRVNAGHESKVIWVNSVTAGMRVLQVGRVDYLLFSKGAMQRYLTRTEFDFKACFSEPIVSVDYYSFLHQHHSDKLETIEAGLRQAKREMEEAVPR